MLVLRPADPSSRKASLIYLGWKVSSVDLLLSLPTYHCPPPHHEQWECVLALSFWFLGGGRVGLIVGTVSVPGTEAVLNRCLLRHKWDSIPPPWKQLLPPGTHLYTCLVCPPLSESHLVGSLSPLFLQAHLSQGLLA